MKRAQFIIDNDDNEENDAWVCDKVRIGLNLAYLHEDTARKFIFNETQLRMKGEDADLEAKPNQM